MINKHYNKFVQDGFVKISNAIDKKLLKRTAETIISHINQKKKNNSKKNLNFLSKKFSRSVLQRLKNGDQFFDMQKNLFDALIKENIVKNILFSKKVHNFLVSMLGPDLQYKIPTEFIINYKGREKNNYLFKNYHQEIWSGASTNTLLIWIPIFQKTTSGQMKLIKGSHLWGHIPHHNKKPIKLPEKYSEISSNCSLGDIIVFHTMTLHKSDFLSSNENVVGRLSLAVRNFKYPKNGFEGLADWKIYTLSPHSIIERHLGNPELSPFRLSPKKMREKSLKNIEL